jgi:hypothetical protein
MIKDSKSSIKNNNKKMTMQNVTRAVIVLTLGKSQNKGKCRLDRVRARERLLSTAVF